MAHQLRGRGLCRLLAVSLILCRASLLSAADLDWLKQQEISPEQVTKALNELRGLPNPEAARRTDELKEVAKTASENGKLAAGLLLAAGLEQTDQKTAARTAYEDLKARAGEGSPYANTANVRLQLLDIPPEGMEAEIDKLAFAPAAGEASGWFLVDNRWVHGTQRQAYLESLVAARADHLSVRFFDYIGSYSPWGKPYEYLFTLLVLTLGIKLVSLPLTYKAARVAAVAKEIAPHLQSLQSAYANDPGGAMQASLQMYKDRGVNPMGGCGAGFIDIVFVIWALVTMSNYAPQMALNGSRFLWVSDVTQYDTWLLLATVALVFVAQFVGGTWSYTGQTPAQLACGSVLGGGVVWLIAWYWQWPAYVFIFWSLLVIVGVITLRGLVPLAKPGK